MNAIRGFQELGKEMGSVSDKEMAKLGEGLLNAASRAAKTDGSLYIEHIERNLIDVNSENFYSITGVESLKLSIDTFGLQQPLIVQRKSDGRYKLMGGERRLTAIDQLIQEGKWNGNIIPCVVQDYHKIELPLDEGEKEKLGLITTNREQRKYSDADLANEIRELKKIYTKLRAAGVTSMVIGMDEKGDEVREQIKGVPTKKLVADKLGISTGKVAALEKIENQGTAELKKALQENRISAVTASEAVELTKDQQKALTSKTEGEIRMEDVRKYQKGKSSKGEVTISPPSWKKMTETLKHAVAQMEKEEFYRCGDVTRRKLVAAVKTIDILFVQADGE